MGKRNQAEPDARKTRVAGNQGAAKSGKGPDTAGKPATRKPVAKKAVPAKPATESASASPKKSPARKPAAKPAASTKRSAAIKPAASARAAASNPEKKTPPSRRTAPQAQPANAEPQSSFLSAAPLDAPPTNLPPVNLPPANVPPGSGLQPTASSPVSRVVLMIRDPEWLYGYWEISEPDRIAHAIGQPQGAPPLLLRVFDQGAGAAPVPTGEYFDVNVIPDASGWYIRVPEGGGHWSAALGYLDYEGAFVSLAQSNVVTTPRPLHGEWNEQAWGPAAPEEASAEDAAGTEPATIVERGPNGETRLVRRAARLMAYMRGLGASEQVLRPGASEQLLRPGASEQFLRVGASEQVPYFGASEQVPFLGASERFGASEQAARQPGGVAVMEKTFWLQVHTELIVYGATEPDAKVTVQGVPIQLRPDGTFALRFALPDGEQVIPVHAINADSDMERTITPIVKKRTV